MNILTLRCPRRRGFALLKHVGSSSSQTADFDGDGLPDVAFAEQEQSETKRIGIFYAQNRTELKWQRQILAATGGHNLKAGIIGHDRLPSTLVANHGFYGAPNPVEQWRNEMDIRPGDESSGRGAQMPTALRAEERSEGWLTRD